MSDAGEKASVETAARVSEDLKQTIEVLIFASDDPLSVKMIRDVIDEGNQQREPSGRLEAGNDDVRAAVVQLNREYEAAQRSFRIMQLAGGYIFATNKKFSMWVGKLFKEKARRKLSATALETLAIIAYKQPITKSEVEFIRGVNADYIMKTLLEKNLITIVGRASTPGRPLLYGTTPDFLKHFGLNEITDLPKPREIEELIGETELEVDKRLLAEQQEIEFKEQLQEKMTPEQRKEKAGGKKNSGPVHQQAPPVQSGAPADPSVPPEQPAAVQEESRVDTAAPLEGVSAEVEGSAVGSGVPEGETAAVEPAITDEIPVAAHAPVEEIAEPEELIVEQTQTEEIEPAAALIEETAGLNPPEVDLQAEPEQEQKSKTPVDSGTAEEVSFAEEQVGVMEGHEVIDGPASGIPPEGPDQSGDQPQKGWSKWKTKLQTFFRKLFA